MLTLVIRRREQHFSVFGNVNLALVVVELLLVLITQIKVLMVVLRGLNFKLGGQSCCFSLGSCLRFGVRSVGIAVDAHLIAIGILFINNCSEMVSSRGCNHNIGQFDGWRCLL